MGQRIHVASADTTITCLGLAEGAREEEGRKKVEGS